MSTTDPNRRSFMRPTGAAAAALTVATLPSFLIGAFAPAIKADIGFGDTGLGALFAAGYLVSAVALQFTGTFADRNGPTTTMRAGIVLAIIGALVMSSVATSYTLIVVAFMLNRASEAVIQPATNTLVAQAVPASQRGLSLGVKQSAIPLSTALAGLAVPLLGTSIGWQGAFVFVAILGVPSFFAVPTVPATTDVSRRSTAELWRTPDLQLISLAGASAAASVVTVAGFLTTAAQDAGYTAGGSGLLLTLGGIVMIFSRLTWGWLADRFAFDRFFAVACAVGAGSVSFLLLAQGTKTSIALGTAVVFGIGWSWPGLLILGVLEKHPDNPGAATAILQTSIRLGALISPIAFGALAERRGFGAAWLMSFGFAVTATILMFAAAAASRRVDEA